MTPIVFYFQVHQPYRVGRYSWFDIGSGRTPFDDDLNRDVLRRVAEKCYLPMNALLKRVIERTDGAVRVAFSISGVAMEQFERWSPETLASFQDLHATGCVELLAETSHHSLAWRMDEREFMEQVHAHGTRLLQHFGVRPRVFRNTELLVDEHVASLVERMGFQGIMAEGCEPLLGWRDCHRVYRPEPCRRLKMLTRDYRLSDDIAFRFSNPAWNEHPLSVARFMDWLEGSARGADYIGLFMDYETFGEHQWASTGIFQFMELLLSGIVRHPDLRLATPSDVIDHTPPVARLPIQRTVSWADEERDMSAWLASPMQRAANDAVYALLGPMRRARARGSNALFKRWRRLTTSDHVYYMSTKFDQDGDVHRYFSPYGSPYEAHIAFMNALEDLRQAAGSAGVHDDAGLIGVQDVGMPVSNSRE